MFSDVNHLAGCGTVFGEQKKVCFRMSLLHAKVYHLRCSEHRFYLRAFRHWLDVRLQTAVKRNLNI